MTSAQKKTASASVAEPDTSYLETLVGYNTRRASLKILESFSIRMAEYDLRPVDFSILSMVHHNPGVTSRQLCTTLDILPPNIVALISALEKRQLLERHPHPQDGRALGLYLSEPGKKLVLAAERTASDLEQKATANLSPSERKTLMRLLQKIYL
jgi:DNA-binding MarR family transcriptional regulator